MRNIQAHSNTAIATLVIKTCTSICGMQPGLMCMASMITKDVMKPGIKKLLQAHCDSVTLL